MNNQRLELVADFYEYTMSNGYLNKKMENQIAYFDVFFRKVPDEGGYAIIAGLEQIINYIKNLSFDEEDINYLRKQNKFSEEFLNYLENFRFTGDVWAIPEGTVVFPNEPLITVRAQLRKNWRKSWRLSMWIREQCTVRWHTIFYRTALHQMMSRRLRQPARRLT